MSTAAAKAAVLGDRVKPVAEREERGTRDFKDGPSGKPPAFAVSLDVAGERVVGKTPRWIQPRRGSAEPNTRYR